MREEERGREGRDSLREGGCERGGRVEREGKERDGGEGGGGGGGRKRECVCVCVYVSVAIYSLEQTSCVIILVNNVTLIVLPKYEVTLTGPEQLEKDDSDFDITVEAKYTFGEDVEGRVKINATLMSSTRAESLVFYDRTANLVYTCICTLWLIFHMALAP